MTTLIDIKMFPASYGDSFLVTCHGERKTHILIDMGFKSTFNSTIKKELEKLGEVSEKISLLVFTHIDEDHILGGIQFLEENGKSDDPNIIRIDEVWYNSLRHIKGNNKKNNHEDNEEINLNADEEISKIIIKGHGRELGVRQVSDVSYKQGSTLAGLLYTNDYSGKWNSTYNHEAITVKSQQNSLKSVLINEAVKLTVISPEISNLQKLSEVWDTKIKNWAGMDNVPEGLSEEAFEIYVANQLEKNKKKKSRAINKISGEVKDIETIANQEFIPDQSVINGSSIAFILEYETKKILFLGDAHSHIVEKNLNKLKSQHEDKLFFDAVKISHHGSKYNMSKSLFELIDTDKYIISTNGNVKNHPDFETFCRIISSNKEKRKKIIFNYKPRIFERINRDDIKKEFNYEIEYTNDINEGTLNEITKIPIKRKSEQSEEF